jgi:hypothetical protein
MRAEEEKREPVRARKIKEWINLRMVECIGDMGRKIPFCEGGENKSDRMIVFLVGFKRGKL